VRSPAKKGRGGAGKGNRGCKSETNSHIEILMRAEGSNRVESSTRVAFTPFRLLYQTDYEIAGYVTQSLTDRLRF